MDNLEVNFPSGQEINLEHAMDAISEHLAILASYTEEVETQLGGLLIDTSVVGEQALGTLQLLDITRQSLVDLSHMSKALSRHPHVDTAQLHSSLKLEAMRAIIFDCDRNAMESKDDKIEMF